MYLFIYNNKLIKLLGQGTIILMNKDFDPVLEVPIHSEIFAAG